jgi:hypothetical protein
MGMTVYFRQIAIVCLVTAFVTGCAVCPLVAETVKVSGHGEVTVQTAKKQKEQAAFNQKALADAEQMAREKAIRQAILQVIANHDALQPKWEEITRTAVENSSTLILDSQVQGAGVMGDKAQVDVVVQVDGKALRALLESNFNLSSTADTEGKFKIYVLSYTLEGMDPNRAQPQITHEETVDDQKGVHASTFANSSSNAASNSSSASLAASASFSDKGKASANANASGQYKGSISGTNAAMGNGGSSYNSGSASQSGSQSASATANANWDVAQSASLDARKHHSESSSNKVASSGSSNDDTSHYYHKVVDYADPTKKGSALSNEVRAEVEGMMTTAGFDVSTLNVAMMDRAFPTEDDLIIAVLDVMRTNPTVSPNDYVAIALNSFTPVAQDTHQFTSKVTYRVVRVKDGMAFLPAKDIIGNSGTNAVSDDMGRTFAVKSAMMQVDEILPDEINQALQKMQRSEKREASNSAAFYVIVVDNATTMTASTPIRNALTTAGFKVERTINGLAKTHTLTVSLNGKTGEDVMNAIEGAMDTYDVQTMDNQGSRVKVK